MSSVCNIRHLRVALVYTSSQVGDSQRPNNVMFFLMLRANVTHVTPRNPHET